MANRFTTFLLLFLVSTAAFAQSIPQQVIDKAATLIPNTLPDSVEATPVSGLYQVSFGMQVVYLFEDGKHLLSGDLINLEAGANLTEDARKSGRKSVIDSLDEEGMVIFTPSETQSTITVFTDTECGYCVRLQSRATAGVSGWSSSSVPGLSAGRIGFGFSQDISVGLVCRRFPGCYE